MGVWDVCVIELLTGVASVFPGANVRLFLKVGFCGLGGQPSFPFLFHIAATPDAPQPNSER